MTWVPAALLVAALQTGQAFTYICPMHPDVIASEPGKCVKCGMPLVAGDPLDAREYLLEVEATPPAVPVGRPTRLRFTVRHPSTHEPARNFAIVHEKPYHLFVISHDLEYYDHVHPDQQPDGSYAIDVVLPRPGYYKLFSDFLPVGGTPQVIPRVIVTAGYAGDLASSVARLQPDATLRHTTGGLTVSLTLPADGLVAGREEKLGYTIAEAASGAAVTDLEPYLAAFGHTLVVSEDSLHYVHAHPVELVPEGDTAAKGGPTLTFKALLPKPGHYRLWTQLKRRGAVSTVTFTVSVASPAGRAAR